MHTNSAETFVLTCLNGNSNFFSSPPSYAQINHALFCKVIVLFAFDYLKIGFFFCFLQFSARKTAKESVVRGTFSGRVGLALESSAKETSSRKRRLRLRSVRKRTFARYVFYSFRKKPISNFLELLYNSVVERRKKPFTILSRVNWRRVIKVATRVLYLIHIVIHMRYKI